MKNKPLVISLDDISEKYKKGWNEVVEFHDEFPESKFTLFVIPEWSSPSFLKEIDKPWTELVYHGGHCDGGLFEWHREYLKSELLRYHDEFNFVKGLKAPGWSLSKENIAACQEIDFWICHRNSDLFGKDIKFWVTKPSSIYDLRMFDDYTEYYSHVQYWDRSAWKLKIYCQCSQPDYKFISEIVHKKNERSFP